MNQFPLISVIATRGEPPLFNRILPSLEECIRPENYKGVILAFNGDNPDCLKALASYSFPVVVVQSDKRNNKSAALNKVLATLKENHLVYFHDDDIRVTQNSLVAMLEAAGSYEKGFFGGPVEPEYDKNPDPDLVPYLPWSAKGFKYDFDIVTELHGTFIGSNWAAFSADLQKAGGFDERLGPGNLTMIGEETKIQRDMSSTVPAYYVPGAKAIHYVPEDRCNFRWAVLRKYKMAVHRGFFSSGIVKVTLYRAARSAAAIVYWTLRRNRARLYKSFFNFVEFSGRLRGVLLKVLSR